MTLSIDPTTRSRGTRSASGPSGPGAGRIDVRGPRVAAGLTTGLLATALVVQGRVGIALVAIQVGVFAVAVVRGVAHSPWAVVFRFVRRLADLGPPPATEDAGPPRAAQGAGLVVAGAGLVALLAGATTTGWVLVATVLALSSLLATTGLCVGCELYLLVLRARTRVAGASS